MTIRKFNPTKFSKWEELISGTFFRSYYGGRLPFIKYYSAKLLAHLGAYRAERKLEWSRVERLVFVCKGNINRSPYAEYYCRAYLDEVRSFGLDATTGLRASEQAITNSLARSIDLSQHVTCRSNDFDFRAGDLLVAFEYSQVSSLKLMDVGPGVQVTLLGLWARDICPYIQDPICREDAYFQVCYSRIEQGVKGILTNCRVG